MCIRLNISVERTNTAKRGHLIDALVTFDVFPNLFAHTIPQMMVNTMLAIAPSTHSVAVKFSRL